MDEFEKEVQVRKFGRTEDLMDGLKEQISRSMGENDYGMTRKTEMTKEELR